VLFAFVFSEPAASIQRAKRLLGSEVHQAFSTAHLPARRLKIYMAAPGAVPPAPGSFRIAVSILRSCIMDRRKRRWEPKTESRVEVPHHFGMTGNGSAAAMSVSELV